MIPQRVVRRNKNIQFVKKKYKAYHRNINATTCNIQTMISGEAHDTIRIYIFESGEEEIMKRIAQRITALLLAITMICTMTMFTEATPMEESQSEMALTDTAFPRVKLFFEDASDGDYFSNTKWSVTEGHWQANAAWQATWLTRALPLSANLNISFDFYIDYTGEMANSLLAFGFMNGEQTEGTVGWLQRSQWGDLLTWTKDGLGGPTSNTYVGDQIVRTSEQVSAGNTAFGSVHHVDITLLDGNMAVSVDDVLMNSTNNANLT